MINKKAQQEIVGFVLIVVIVVIIGVIFLGISLRKDRLTDTSVIDVEMENFLSVSRDYTTNCVFRDQFADIEELAKECYKGRSCEDGRYSCDVLELEYKQMLESLWPCGGNRPIKSVKLDVFYQTQDKQASESVVSIFNCEIDEETGEESSCAIRKAGITNIDEYPGNIVVKLELCN